jgi:hypothetical protein
LVRVYGVVTDGITNQPIAGARVLLYLSTKYETTTDSSGRYELRNVASNLTYYFNVTKEGYNTYFTYLEVRTSDVEHNVKLYPSGVQYAFLSVTVAEDITLVKIPGARVTVRRNGTVVGDGYTDYYGHIDFSFAQGGEYSVTVEATNYYPQTRSVTLEIGTTKTLYFYLESSVPKTGDVEGYVKDDKGNPLMGVMVMDLTERVYTTSGTGGYYSLVRLQPGTHSINASKTGYTEETKTVTIEAGKTTQCDFTLKEIRYTLTIRALEGGTTSPPPGKYEYKPNELTGDILAIPDSGYVFDHWTLDSQVRKSNPTAVAMDRDYTLTAYFSKPGAPPATIPTEWLLLAGAVAVFAIGAGIYLSRKG